MFWRGVRPCENAEAAGHVFRRARVVVRRGFGRVDAWIDARLQRGELVTFNASLAAAFDSMLVRIACLARSKYSRLLATKSRDFCNSFR